MIHNARFRFRMSMASLLGARTGLGHRSNERGANLVEYTLLLVLIVLVCIGAVTLLGEATNEPYSEFGSQLGS